MSKNLVFEISCFSAKMTSAMLRQPYAFFLCFAVYGEFFGLFCARLILSLGFNPNFSCILRNFHHQLLVRDICHHFASRSFSVNYWKYGTKDLLEIIGNLQIWLHCAVCF
jgi:hypothetical protein